MKCPAQDRGLPCPGLRAGWIMLGPMREKTQVPLQVGSSPNLTNHGLQKYKVQSQMALVTTWWHLHSMALSLPNFSLPLNSTLRDHAVSLKASYLLYSFLHLLSPLTLLEHYSSSLWVYHLGVLLQFCLSPKLVAFPLPASSSWRSKHSQ